MNLKKSFFNYMSIHGNVITALTGLLLLSSCFHKDVRTDNIASSIIYQDEEGDYIICKEVIFQATSKSSKGGFTQISGYNEYRISSYDMQTGKLL